MCGGVKLVFWIMLSLKIVGIYEIFLCFVDNFERRMKYVFLRNILFNNKSCLIGLSCGYKRLIIVFSL